MPNTNFPTSIDAPTDPTSSNTLNSPSHSAQHSFENDAIVALETKVGVNGSAVNTTLDYKLSGVTTGDKAASLTGAETLTNKTLGSGAVIGLGSDSTGDIYYRNGSGQLARLPIGSSGQILDVSVAGLPEWIANPSAANASTTVKGVAQIAATADITAGTSTGSTGATLVVPASAVGAAGANKLVQYDASGKLPAVDGSQLTNLTNPAIFKTGSFQKLSTDASTTQTIAHGCGKTPKLVRFSMFFPIGGSIGQYNGSSSNCVWQGLDTNGSVNTANGDTTNVIKLDYGSGSGSQLGSGNSQAATVTLDSTNINLTWTKTNTPASVTMYITWEAIA